VSSPTVDGRLMTMMHTFALGKAGTGARRGMRRVSQPRLATGSYSCRPDGAIVWCETEAAGRETPGHSKVGTLAAPGHFVLAERISC
jgi:hypothetical protein